MFHLENAITQWRKRLTGREAFTEADLDEMEGHLRDEIDSHIASGQSEKDAFFQATRGFGENLKLAWRFNRANWEKVMAKRTRYAPILIGNYFKVAIRNLLKHKAYSFINISGLALGIACCILVLLFVQNEWRYDKHHINANQIYRIVSERINKQNGQSEYFEYTAYRLAPALKANFPEIQQTVRLHRVHVPLSYQDKSYWDIFYFTDPNIFDVFTLPFLKGDPKTALSDPFTVVLTQKTARKFFGDENPIGKTITYDDDVHLKVTGVLKDLPSNTHLPFDFLASLTTFVNRFGKNYKLDSWDESAGYAYTYFLLPDIHSYSELETKIPEFIETHIDKGESAFRKFHLQALTDIHLYSKQRFAFASKGDIGQIYLLLTVAFIVLTIACFNYMNLSTARFTTRAREVGMRKVVGARRFQIAKQFMGESIFLTAIACLFAVGLSEYLRPTFNTLVGTDLQFHAKDYWLGIVGFIVITFCIGTLAGLYPAIFLSSFQPVDVLKGTKKDGKKSALFRKLLVTFQFAMCIALICATSIVYQQRHYLQNKELGFDKDHIVAIQNAWKAYQKKGGYESFQTRIVSHPNIVQTAISSYKPLFSFYKPQKVSPEGATENDEWSMQVVLTNHTFIDLLGMELISGRNFSTEFSTDKKEAVILNEAAVKAFSWKNPIDKTLEVPYLALGWKRAKKKAKVIGVVKNTHFESLHRKVPPTAFTLSPDGFNYYLIKVGSENIPETISFLETTWKKMAKGSPMEYTFLDQRFEALYRAEEKLNTVFAYFVLLGIFVACMGLFGLAAFVVEQKTKEIGIRKILGASTSNLTLLLSKDFLALVLLSNLVAWPVAYYTMNQWLQDFAYRMDLNIETFGLAGVLTLVIALTTVGYQTLKASTANPVDTLRHE